MPCKALRCPNSSRSRSNSAACLSASGFISRMARSAGPLRLTSSIRAKYACYEVHACAVDQLTEARTVTKLTLVNVFALSPACSSSMDAS